MSDKDETSPPTVGSQPSQNEQGFNAHFDESPMKAAFNHQQLGLFADSSMQAQSELGDNIKLSIDFNETRGNAFMKYVVYRITGTDKNGPIDVFRRFNEFYKMRAALIKRFPGCFIPSIPDKSISIVDDEIANKRQRFLNDFVKKMSKLPHLYNSEEFQALLRSTQKDLSSNFEKWPNPTTSDIINKYKDSFSHLSGKVVDTGIRTNIHDFTKLIERTSVYMYKFKSEIKALALARDRFDRKLVNIFTKSLPSFESECLSECVTSEEELVYANPNQAKFLEHEKIVTQTLKRNPYWLLYDLIKHEERDGQAFLECAKAIEQYENKKYEIEVKLGENNKAISEITLGKKSNSEGKYKLEVENEALKKEKEAVQCLTDIIIALVAFVEIDRFKREKSLFYVNILKKIGGYEINQVQNMHEVWYDWRKKAKTLKLDGKE